MTLTLLVKLKDSFPIQALICIYILTLMNITTNTGNN